MATYKQIQNFVQEHHSVNVQTCWIAHMKEKCGLPRRKAQVKDLEICGCATSRYS